MSEAARAIGGEVEAGVARAGGGRFVRDVTLLGTVALCVGNMVGTSIYTLPASLAATTGPLGVVAWVVTAAGYALVAVVYASLGVRYPRCGGPYVFAREAFGDAAGFATVWSYWVSAVVGNAAIVTSVVGYAAGFSPLIAGSRLGGFLLAQALVWGLCWINVRGVRESTRLQTAIMLVTIVPLLALSLLALGAFDPSHLVPFAPRGYGSIAAGAALVVWAYAGIESATVAAEEVRDPRRTIGRGTMLGYAVATLVFLLIAFSVAGALPNADIAASARPLALVMERTVGPWAAAAIGVGAMVSGVGTLNGWTLMAGRIPVSAARDGLFFPALARLHPRHGTPHVALVVGSAVTSATLTMYFTRSLLGAFTFIALFGVLTTLVPHLLAMAAEVRLARRDPSRYTPGERRRAMIVAPLAFLFVLYTIYGVGLEVAMWGLGAMAAGVPLYAGLRRRAVGAG